MTHFCSFVTLLADVSRRFGLMAAMFGLMAAMFVFQAELSDGIAVLVASNDHIQDLISQMEELCQTIEVSWWKVWWLIWLLTPDPRSQENGKQQRERLDGHFQRLLASLEERKQELVGLISREQDHKLKQARSLLCCYGEELEAAVALVESAIQSMEEPYMAAFIQVGHHGYPGKVRDVCIVW